MRFETKQAALYLRTSTHSLRSAAHYCPTLHFARTHLVTGEQISDPTQLELIFSHAPIGPFAPLAKGFRIASGYHTKLAGLLESDSCRSEATFPSTTSHEPCPFSNWRVEDAMKFLKQDTAFPIQEQLLWVPRDSVTLAA